MRLRGKAGISSVTLPFITFLCAYSLFLLYRQRYHSGTDTNVAKGNFQPYQPLKTYNTTSHDTSSATLSNELGFKSGLQDVPTRNFQVDWVVASLAEEDTTWMNERLGEWKPKIYVVNNPHAALTVPLNKGRESMVYLTYIIEHYHQLPDVMLFTHATRFQWHNDDPDYDGLAVLRRLQLPYVQSQGYVNLRCTWTLGCRVEIRPFADEGLREDYKKTASVYKRAFEELLPGTPVPEEVGQSCCAQFAVTRDAILSRDLDVYQHMRDWLINTSLDDSTTGRVFEYTWHIIFGKEPVFCPDAASCYCRLFALCDNKCEEGHCEGRYALPPYSTLPQGWPYVDWDGSPRKFIES